MENLLHFHKLTFYSAFWTGYAGHLNLFLGGGQLSLLSV